MQTQIAFLLLTFGTVPILSQLESPEGPGLLPGKVCWDQAGAT